MANPTLTSMAINARLTLSLHALNNEGTQGNARLIRRVNIFDPRRRLPVSVNAISGEMLKHMAFEHLINLALRDGFPLSNVARAHNPMRAGLYSQRGLTTVDPADRLAEAIQTCVADDLLGFLELRESKGNIPRKSLIEFGWMPAIPGQSLIEAKDHSRFTDEQSGEKSENAGQMRFSVEVASGDYAFTSFFDIAGIGYNPEAESVAGPTNCYSIENEERVRRTLLGLETMYQTLLSPLGASRTATLAHVHGISGAVTLGFSHTPAPAISPLEEDYRTQLQSICDVVNRGFGLNNKPEIKKAEYISFNNFEELGTVLQGISKALCEKDYLLPGGESNVD